MNEVDELLAAASELHNELAPLIFSKVPRPVAVLAVRMMVHLGEGTMGGSARDAYLAARGMFYQQVNETMRRLGKAPIPGDGAISVPDTCGDDLEPEQLAERAGSLAQELQMLLVGSGHAMEVGLLACAAMVHMGERILKLDGDDGPARFKRYQLAFKCVLEEADAGLIAENVPKDQGGN